MSSAGPRRERDLLYAAGALVVLYGCAVLVHPNQVSGLERSVFHVVNGLPDLFYWPVWVVMQLGNLLAIPVAAIASFVFRRWLLGASLLIAGVGKTLLSREIKDLVTRHRPAAIVDDVIRRGDAAATGEAFVSGHAVVAFAIAVLVHQHIPSGRRWIAWVLAGAVCLGRVYVGAHLPLDVVGGAAMGTAIGLLLRFLLASAPEEPKPAAPPSPRATP